MRNSWLASNWSGACDSTTTLLPTYTSGKAVYHDFRQIRGIGRAGANRTALITINITPLPAERVRITAPFLGHAATATVLFENRSVPVRDGVIVDSFAGLEAPRLRGGWRAVGRETAPHPGRGRASRHRRGRCVARC